MVCVLKTSNFLYETNKKAQTEKNIGVRGAQSNVRKVDNSV